MRPLCEIERRSGLSLGTTVDWMSTFGGLEVFQDLRKSMKCSLKVRDAIPSGDEMPGGVSMTQSHFEPQVKKVFFPPDGDCAAWD